MLLFLPIYVLAKKPRFILTDQGPWILAFLWKPLLSRCTGVKVILDIRSTPVEVHGFQMAVKDFFFKLSVIIAKRMFDGITAASTLMRDDIAASFQINPDDIGVWPNGAAIELFDPAKYVAEGALLRQSLGLTNSFTVLYHGVVSLHRGLTESVLSVEMLEKGKYDDVILFILGSGPAMLAIRQLVKERGLQDRVIFHDAVHYNDVPKYIAMADVGLVPLPNLPDWVHQCPLNLLELLAMKKPVILTDIPCNRGIVGTNKCGTYVKDADPKELAQAISFLHDNRKMLEEWRAQGRSIVEQKFTWNASAKSLEDYLIGL
jgi:glycosyltransferase involved in cell wall biosynthesis